MLRKVSYRKIILVFIFSFIVSLVSVSWFELINSSKPTASVTVETSIAKEKKRSVMALCSGILFVAVDYLWDRNK